MPLSILSHIAREAPLGSLLIAFLLGVAVARRRWRFGGALFVPGWTDADRWQMFCLCASMSAGTG